MDQLSNLSKTAKVTMSQSRREKLLRVVDGDPRVLYNVYCLNNFRRSEEILNWLIANNLTGRNLFDWLNFHFPHKLLEPGQWILKQVDKDKELRPVIAGRDYLRLVTY